MAARQLRAAQSRGSGPGSQRPRQPRPDRRGLHRPCRGHGPPVPHRDRWRRPSGATHPQRTGTTRPDRAAGARSNPTRSVPRQLSGLSRRVQPDPNPRTRRPHPNPRPTTRPTTRPTPLRDRTVDDTGTATRYRRGERQPVRHQPGTRPLQARRTDPPGNDQRCPEPGIPGLPRQPLPNCLWKNGTRRQRPTTVGNCAVDNGTRGQRPTTLGDGTVDDSDRWRSPPVGTTRSRGQRHRRDAPPLSRPVSTARPTCGQRSATLGDCAVDDGTAGQRPTTLGDCAVDNAGTASAWYRCGERQPVRHQPGTRPLQAGQCSTTVGDCAMDNTGRRSPPVGTTGSRGQRHRRDAPPLPPPVSAARPTRGQHPTAVGDRAVDDGTAGQRPAALGDCAVDNTGRRWSSPIRAAGSRGQRHRRNASPLPCPVSAATRGQQPAVFGDCAVGSTAVVRDDGRTGPWWWLRLTRYRRGHSYCQGNPTEGSGPTTVRDQGVGDHAPDPGRVASDHGAAAVVRDDGRADPRWRVRLVGHRSGSGEPAADPGRAAPDHGPPALVRDDGRADSRWRVRLGGHRSGSGSADP